MKKQRIVLASVLKPVDDTRMFEKIGKSLAKKPDYKLSIFGYPSNKQHFDSNIELIPHPHFARISLKRMLIPLILLKKIYKVKPHVLIVNTHELLIVATTIRILFGTKLIYDVQENYWRNILWTTTFPPLLRHLLAGWVRGKEIIFSGAFQLFFLAEKGFEKEMTFFKNRYLTLENKSALPEGLKHIKSASRLNLLFSGTISGSTGIFQAINLANQLHQIDEFVRLTIIGYCAMPATWKRIIRMIKDKPFITLIGGDQLVPHEAIVSQIMCSDFGIISYPTSPHTENKIPTKLYEYLSAQLPMLLQEHQPWISICEPYQAAIPINLNLPVDAPVLLKKMQETHFYTTSPSDVFWVSEEKKLLDSVDKILV